MQKYGVWIIALAGLIITGCASVKPVEFKKFGNTSKYKYAVVGKTQALRSQYGSSTKDSDGDVHYSSQSNSINPNNSKYSDNLANGGNIKNTVLIINPKEINKIKSFLYFSSLYTMIAVIKTI